MAARLGFGESQLKRDTALRHFAFGQHRRAAHNWLLYSQLAGPGGAVSLDCGEQAAAKDALAR